MPNETTLDAVIPFEEVENRWPHIKAKTLKWQCTQRHLNGAKEAGVFVKVGKSFYCHVDRYSDWLIKQNHAA